MYTTKSLFLPSRHPPSRHEVYQVYLLLAALAFTPQRAGAVEFRPLGG